MAQRMLVSTQTLQRIEAGDPSISIGIFMSCTFCLNRIDELRDILTTNNDVYGNILEEQKRSIQRKARASDRPEEDELDF